MSIKTAGMSTPIESPHEVANLLNEYFAAVGESAPASAANPQRRGTRATPTPALSEDVRQCVELWVNEGWCGVAEEEIYDEQGNGVVVVSAKTLPFEVLAAVRELCAAAAPAPPAYPAHPSHPHDAPAQLLDAYLWFEPLIDRWLAVTKTMALQRVRAAVELGNNLKAFSNKKVLLENVNKAELCYSMFGMLKNKCEFLKAPNNNTKHTGNRYDDERSEEERWVELRPYSARAERAKRACRGSGRRSARTDFVL
ncbi:hypothetical protein MSG28_005178 [Choristoneura fumiferana]|uniref:Uncharacterized protein n=1 Tax=Choristoneura fumiferana TaxID=7141 RepID=A0ACC0JQM0_CHOFU|nr:hypothetical protein MSG28_005178 [Choristoneura fumiferana]